MQIVTGSKDVAVYIEGCHSCMTARGIKKNNSKTITTTFRGEFENDTLMQMRVLAGVNGMSPEILGGR